MQHEIENAIIEKNPGFSNYEMLKYCELLNGVISQTIETSSGRGKNVRKILQFKHNTDKEIRERIKNSCEHYKKLHEMEKKEIGSLEITRYKFEYVNGEPKIIIEMVKVLDKNGKYIKFAKLEGVTAFLSKYPVKFKES
jgi:predicted ATP-dependent protease